MRLSKLSKVIIAIVFLTATTVFGGAFGWIAGKTLYWGSESVAIVAIDSGGSGAQQYHLRYPNIIDYLKSPAFAEKVASEANFQQLAGLLPSSEFGGKNALSVRQLRDTDEIELRVRLVDPSIPQPALIAVTNTLMRELASARESTLQSQDVKWLIEDLEETKNLEEAIYLRLVRDISDNNKSFVDVELLNSLPKLREEKLTLHQKLLAATGKNGETTGPAVVMPPTPALGILDSPAKTIGLGSFAGLCIGFLTLLGWMTRQHGIESIGARGIDVP